MKHLRRNIKEMQLCAPAVWYYLFIQPSLTLTRCESTEMLIIALNGAALSCSTKIFSLYHCNTGRMQSWNLLSEEASIIRVCVLALIRLLSLFSPFFLPLRPHSHPPPHLTMMCMYVLNHAQPPLPSACHMVHSFLAFDMRCFKKVLVPVEILHVL